MKALTSWHPRAKREKHKPQLRRNANRGGQGQPLKGNGFAADEMAELSYKRAIAAALTVAEAEFRIAHEASLSAERESLQTELCDASSINTAPPFATLMLSSKISFIPAAGSCRRV